MNAGGQDGSHHGRTMIYMGNGSYTDITAYEDMGQLSI